MKGTQPGQNFESHAETENIERRAALSSSPEHTSLVEGGGEK